MRAFRRILAGILVITMMWSGTGCKKQRDIEDSCFILAMGFEKINEKKYLIRYSYADFDGNESNMGTKVPSKSITFLADSFQDANKIWEKYQAKQQNFGHLKVVFFGNQKADSKIVTELLQHPHIAKSVFVLKTEKNIEEVFSREKNLPVSFGEYVAHTIENSEKIKEPKNLTLGRIMY